MLFLPIFVPTGFQQSTYCVPTFSFLDPHLGFEHLRFSFEIPPINNRQCSSAITKPISDLSSIKTSQTMTPSPLFPDSHPQQSPFSFNPPTITSLSHQHHVSLTFVSPPRHSRLFNVVVTFSFVMIQKMMLSRMKE